MTVHTTPSTELVLETRIRQEKRGFLRAVSALQQRNFRLFWFGQMISLTGTWMDSTGQAWLVLERTHNPLALGIVGALQFLPVMLFSLFGGVIADRLPKRRVLLCTQSFALLQAAVLWTLVATGQIQLWHIYGLALLLGINNAIDMPTRQSFVVEMVGRENLPNAIALNSSLFNMARIVGPGIAGLLIAALGIAPLFLLNALSFIPVIVGLAFIDQSKLYARVKLPIASNEKRVGTLRSLGEGFAYIKRTPAVFMVIAIIGWLSLFGINFNIVLPLFAQEVLHAGPAGFGFLSSAFGAGSLVSALVLAWRNDQPTIKQILIGSTLFCLLEAACSFSHWDGLWLLLIASVGFFQILFTATANTTLQTVTPDHLRGRIMSVYMLFFTGTIPIGNLLVGSLAGAFGAPVALLTTAIISSMALVPGWLLRHKAETSVVVSEVAKAA